jgi:hypothetical protein
VAAVGPRAASALAQGEINMDIRLFQGQPVLVLERFARGSVRCCTVFSGRGLSFEFITEEDALMPEETNNSAGAGVKRYG